MKPEISVIVLTFNQEATISRTIESILAQIDAPEYEVIIGEDCSTDRTRKICEEYRSKYPDKIRLISSECNRGITRNYKDCFQSAQGKYIADCSGDDYWTDAHFLRKGYDVLSNCTNVGLVYSGIAGRPVRNEGLKNGREDLIRMLDSTGIPDIVLSASIYRRDLIVNAAEREGLFDYQCEDFPIMALLFSKSDVYAIEGEALNYETEAPSASRPADEDTSTYNALADLMMRLELSRKYNVTQRKMSRYLTENIKFIASKLINHPSEKKERRLDDLLGEIEINLPLKVKFYLFALRHECLRRVLAKSKKIKGKI